MPRKPKEPRTKASRKAPERGPVSKRVLEPIDGPELIIGLIGAVGTDLQVVIDVLKKELVEVGYGSECIRLSELLQEFNQSTTVVDDLHEDDRIRRLMRAGNELRQVVARGDAMALLAISAVGRRREELGGRSNVARPKTALSYPHSSIPMKWRLCGECMAKPS